MMHNDAKIYVIPEKRYYQGRVETVGDEVLIRPKLAWTDDAPLAKFPVFITTALKNVIIHVGEQGGEPDASTATPDATVAQGPATQ